MTDIQKDIYASCREFAENELSPNMTKWDEEEIFPRDALRKAGHVSFKTLYFVIFLQFVSA
jgi:isobutyryl-CoA dehydrogenase